MSEIKELSLISNAKINLYLDITGKRGNGYHEIETVMQSIDFCDVVTVTENPDSDFITITCTNPAIPTNRKNVCFKAADMFFEAANFRRGLNIHIEKRIPTAAGLGGGSSNAAAVLTALEKMYPEVLPREKILNVAKRAGADVPFCFFGGTRLCKGIGELMTEIPPFEKRFYLVVMPDFLCDTRGAYMAYDDAPLPRRGGLSAFLKAGVDFPKKTYNVFKEIYEDSRINGITERLYELGAEGANLTGSGAACFGIFSKREGAENAAKQFPRFFTRVCEPVNQGVVLLER